MIIIEIANYIVDVRMVFDDESWFHFDLAIKNHPRVA